MAGASGASKKSSAGRDAAQPIASAVRRRHRLAALTGLVFLGCRRDGAFGLCVHVQTDVGKPRPNKADFL